MSIIIAVELLPTLAVGWLSLTDYNPLAPDSWRTYVGLTHYDRMVNDPLVWEALRNTLYFAVLYMPAAILGGLFVAMLLNRGIRGRAVFRGIYFLPVIVSWVVAATMITWFIDPSVGFLSIVLEKFNLGTMPELLRNSETAMPAIATVAIWKYFGYNVVIYLAGLQTLDASLDEAARMDGASTLQRLWHVTLPQLHPVTAVVITLNLIQAIRVFDPMLIMTNGGPNFATTSMVLYIYRTAWDGLQFGYGSAISVLLTALIVVAAAAQMWVFNRRSAR